ncbi:MAG: hypothetical protein KDC53_03255 [Saprospiraceae bacterium]|nr:hypothetical protein [Saprospiraceae bacterium]
MNKSFIFLTGLLLNLQMNLNSQNQLFIEGNVDTTTILDDGFEDGNLSPFSTGGDATWSIQSLMSNTGSKAAISGLIAEDQESYLEYNLTVPVGATAIVSFAAKVSTYNVFTFTVDGEIVWDIYGTSDWNTYSPITLGEGNYILRWSLNVSYTDPPFQDKAWLDDVNIYFMDHFAIKIKDNTEGVGKILTSDKEGNAYWSTPSSLFSKPQNLPLSLSGKFSGPILTIENNFPGVYSETSPSLGIKIPVADIGICVDSSVLSGFRSINSVNFGFESLYAGYSGFASTGGIRGFQSNDASFVGFESNSSSYGFENNFSTSHGFVSYGAGGDGIYVTGSSGFAGNFDGDVQVTGMLTNGGGSLKIDHPLDPENKYLYHSFVESADMMNIYNGNISLDANGSAVVVLPDWFEALNFDFRYQLTCIGGYAQIYISEKIVDNQFRIAGGTPGLEVSWQVTGVRKDPYAVANPIVTEVEKPLNEKGYFLHPKAYGFKAEKGINYQISQENLTRDQTKIILNRQ